MYDMKLKMYKALITMLAGSVRDYKFNTDMFCLLMVFFGVQNSFHNFQVT